MRTGLLSVQHHAANDLGALVPGAAAAEMKELVRRHDEMHGRAFVTRAVLIEPGDRDAVGSQRIGEPVGDVAEEEVAERRGVDADSGAGPRGRLPIVPSRGDGLIADPASREHVR